jgi:hypothetical protein
VDEFSSAVAGLPDINGAGGGARTLVVGAALDDDGGPDRGAVYVPFLDGVSASYAPELPRGAVAALGQAFPSPFRPYTTIPYRLESAARVQLDVWDVTGRLVRTLVDETAIAGEHRAVWRGVDDSGRLVPSGTFFVRMTVDGRPVSGARKIQVLR